MLNFITEKVNIKRLTTTTGNKKSYTVVLSNLDFDIQPLQGETLLADSVQDKYTAYYETINENEIVYNDTVISGSKTYIVESIKFWKGGGVFPSYMELILSLNKTGE